ncbi:hypothetical protein HH214_05520 [Mucilaginibacter robiniae]|uniref:Uncharacterized protein n=1 Tax=Mucilaginibacter robiniae TaxID=2728022 RepID=A0A7L5DZ41_9SPHI|nr:hypothetical protein [Mucilaginibacter robiniae]QJD95367.1 hypothetical protein HH214_05520 [Mucilaginibacter robiniae]
MSEPTPANLRYLLSDDLYLLPDDAAYYREPRQPMETNVLEPVPVISFKHLGNNEKSFLILSYYPDQEFMTPTHLTALESTLKRKEMSMDNVALLNLATYPDTDWATLVNYFTPEKVLLLGLFALPANAPALQQHNLQQHHTQQVLYTYSFDEMVGNKDNTKAFWNLIKTF